MTTKTAAEQRYDDLKSGAAYVRQAVAQVDQDDQLINMLDDLYGAEDDETACPDCTKNRDCPACLAKYEAERQQIIARANAAPTVTERVELLLGATEMPDGNQIFDLLLDNQIASYVWWRCVDWVLYRQRQGLPVKRMNDKDDCPAAIDARFTAARDLSQDMKNWRPDSPNQNMRLLCQGQTIEQWERTPEQQAEIDRTNELMIKIFEYLEATK